MATTTIINTPVAFRETQLGTRMPLPLEGVSSMEIFSDRAVSLVFRKSIPWGIVERYQRAAMRLAKVKQLEDGTWYASVQQLRGAWANEASPWVALKSLEEVILDWIVLKVSSGDHDFPVLEGIDINGL